MMDLLCVKYVLCLLTCAGASFGEQLLLPSNLDGEVGGNLIFYPIKIPSPPYSSVSWVFKGINIVIVVQNSEVIWPTYITRINFSLNTLSLELRNLSKDDTGTYSLSVTKGTSLFNKETSLQVFDRVSNVITTVNETELVEFNSSVSLNCSASGSSLSFLWLNDSSEIKPSERVQLIDDNRTLIISSVRREETGPYTCEVSNPVSKVTSSLPNLTINYGPENVVITADSTFPIYASGSNLTLNCSAASKPVAEFHWAVNGKELNKISTELKLENIQSNQGGSYTCRAQNNKTLRNIISQSLNISVLEKVTGANLTGPTFNLIDGISSANVTCTGSGDITSTEWMKDNQKLSAGDNIKFTPDNRTVMISPVLRKDAGKYQCNISNPVSSDTADFTMIINFGPDNIKINGKNMVEEEQTITLTCTTESTPNPTYRWNFNGTITRISTAEYTVKNASFKDSGTYTCTASNTITKRDATATVDVEVKGKGSISGGGSSGSLSGGAIAGIVIGVIIGVLLIAALTFYIVKYKKIGFKGNKHGGAQNPETELQYADIQHNKNRNAAQPVSTGSYGVQFNPDVPNTTIYSEVKRT